MGTAGTAGRVCAPAQCNGRDDDCDGQTIIVFTGNAGSALDALGVLCGVVQVREDRTSEKFKYSVAVTPSMEFPSVGGDGGTQHLIESLLLCGPDEVVVAAKMATEPPGGACPNNGCAAAATGNVLGCEALYGLAVSCARYNIVGIPGAFKLAVAGTPIASATAGGTGRAGAPADTPAFPCLPTGMVRQANGAHRGAGRPGASARARAWSVNRAVMTTAVLGHSELYSLVPRTASGRSSLEMTRNPHLANSGAAEDKAFKLLVSARQSLM
ncbi:MAG: hypothetical protein ABJA82_16265 [Myxococcales bacterium]